jgi:hypothetical protein
MASENQNKFFQNEKKFVVGKSYETLQVKSLPWGTYPVNFETCDEIGNIIPNTEKFLGKYISSINVGYGDNGTRYDYFKNLEGTEIVHYLNYEGTTRYREVKTFIDERLSHLLLVEYIRESINPENMNLHINKYLLNQEITKNCKSHLS